MRRAASWAWLGSLLFNCVFILLFLIYPSTCTAIFSAFPCKELDDGSMWLRADLLIDCASDAHKGMMAYAGVMVLVFPLGAPALYGYLLFKCHGKTLTALKDVEVQRTMLAKQAKAQVAGCVQEAAENARDHVVDAVQDALSSELTGEITKAAEMLGDGPYRE